MFKCLVLGLLCIVWCSCCAVEPISIKIVAINDFHGNLLPPGKLAEVSGQPASNVGGIDYLAAYVDERIGHNPHHVVVAAGDLVGASPLISASYHDEASIEALSLLGLDLTSVGNHEFDEGSQELLRKQNGGCLAPPAHTCLEHGKFPGAMFKYLASNVVVDKTGNTLFPPYEIRNVGDVRIAFIGLVLRKTPTIVLPRGVAGLTFLDEAETVRRLAPEIRSKGATSIVVLIHQGAAIASQPGTSINDCKGVIDSPGAAEIQEIVKGLPDDVDVVVSAHSHVAYDCQMKNASGKLVLVTQASAFGRVITDIDMDFDSKTHRAMKVMAKNILVNRDAADLVTSPVHPFLSSTKVSKIRALVADYARAVAPIANQVVGSIAKPLPSTANPDGEELAGDLVADSQLAATVDRHVVMSFVNGSGVRNPGFNPSNATYPHDVTYQEAFTVRPFGNSLVSMTLTAQELKDVLEQQFAGCSGQTGDNILQFSKGTHVEWSASAAPCNKIVNLTLTREGSNAPEQIVSNHKVVDPQKNYRISTDNYLAAGKSNFSVFLLGRDEVGGPQDIDALVTYLKSAYLPPKQPFDPSDSRLGIPRLKKGD